MAHLQRPATLAHGILVHEADAADVGDHPAVVKRGVQGGDQILGEGAQQHAPHLQPAGKVDGGALQTAPFAADGDHVTLAVQVAQTLFAVQQQILPLGAGHGADILDLACHAAAVVLDALPLAAEEGFIVGLPGHTGDDAAHFLQVLQLGLQIHIILGLEKGGIGILVVLLGH